MDDWLRTLKAASMARKGQQPVLPYGRKDDKYMILGIVLVYTVNLATINYGI